MKVSLILFSLWASIGNAQSVQSGIWQADSSVELNGIPLPSSKDEKCITPTEAKDIKAAILKELGKTGCESTKWTVKGKNVEITLKCEKSDLKAKGTLKGQITEKSYELKGDADGSFKSIPSQATLNLQGHWLRKCDK